MVIAMNLDVVFTCGCCVRVKSKEGNVTTFKCRYHNKGVSAVSQSTRTRSEYKAKNLKVVMCPASEISNHLPNQEGFLVIEAGDRPTSVKGKRVVLKNARSLSLIAHCLVEAKAVFVHTEIPVVFRMCKMPDLIQTLMYKGKKSGNKDVKKAS